MVVASKIVRTCYWFAKFAISCKSITNFDIVIISFTLNWRYLGLFGSSNVQIYNIKICLLWVLKFLSIKIFSSFNSIQIKRFVFLSWIGDALSF